MKNFLSVAVGAYLGGSLGFFAHVYFYNWQWWAILIPTVLLSSWAEYKAKG